jgi:hypothetical protein
LHYRVVGTAQFFVRDPEFVYAEADGQYFPLVSLGDEIPRNALIARIVNHELMAEQIAKQGMLRETEQRHRDLLIQQGLGAKTESELEFVQAKIQSLTDDLLALDRLAKQLDIRASRAGRMMATEDASSEQTVHQYFDPNGHGRKVERGALLGIIGDPNQMSGFMPVMQDELELVRVGDRAKVFVPQSEPCWGTVRSVAVSTSEIRPRREFQTVPESAKTIIELQFDAPVPLVHGSTSTVAILGERMTLLQMAARSIRSAFYW